MASIVSAGGATNYLPTFPSVSPSNNNVMPLPLNTSDRRSSVEIGNNNDRKLSLSYEHSSFYKMILLHAHCLTQAVVQDHVSVLQCNQEPLALQSLHATLQH